MTATLFDLEPVRISPRAVSASHYTRNLARVLGNGAEWEYSGDCTDLGAPTGKCACGHMGLRYLFTLNHPDGRKAVVGSVCVGNYPGISPALADRLAAEVERLQAAAREAQRQAIEASQSSVVQALMRQWSAAEYQTDQAVADWHNRNQWARWYPHAIYRRPYASERLADRADDRLHPFCCLPVLKTSAGQAKRLRHYLTECARELEQARAAE